MGGAGIQMLSLCRASARRIHLEAGNVFCREVLAARLRALGARHSLAELDESTAQKGGAKILQCAEMSRYDGGASFYDVTAPAKFARGRLWRECIPVPDRAPSS